VQNERNSLYFAIIRDLMQNGTKVLPYSLIAF